MTPEQLEQVRSSYATLGDAATTMATEFYRRLFEADPSTRDLFVGAPDVMAVKFAAELEAIVQAITAYDVFAPRVTDLATRHRHYGVQTHHYRLVGDALLGALAEQLSDVWSAELEAAWRRAYNLVAEMMMATVADAPRRS